MLAVLAVSTTAFILLTKNVFLPDQGAFSEAQDSAEARAEARASPTPFIAGVRQGSEGRSQHGSRGQAEWQWSSPGSTAPAKRPGLAMPPDRGRLGPQGCPALQGAQDSRFLASRSALKRSSDDERYATPGYTSEYAPEYPQEDPPDTPYHPLEEGPLAIAGTVVNEGGRAG